MTWHIKTRPTRTILELVDFLIDVQPVPVDQRSELESGIKHVDSVVSACFSPGHPHMLEITYNPDVVSSDAVLARVSRRGIPPGKVSL